MLYAASLTTHLMQDESRKLFEELVRARDIIEGHAAETTGLVERLGEANIEQQRLQQELRHRDDALKSAMAEQNRIVIGEKAKVGVLRERERKLSGQLEELRADAAQLRDLLQLNGQSAENATQEREQMLAIMAGLEAKLADSEQKGFNSFQKWEVAAEALHEAELRADTALVEVESGKDKCNQLKQKLDRAVEGPKIGPALAQVTRRRWASLLVLFVTLIQQSFFAANLGCVWYGNHLLGCGFAHLSIHTAA